MIRGSGPPGPIGLPGSSGAPGTPGQTVGNALLGGGGIVHTGLLNITVAAASYMIAGVAKTSAQTDLSLGTADVTHPRIDVIALNSSGAAVVVAGVAAASPFEPVLDPATQIRLTAFQVDAGATVLNTTSTIIYTEGGGESWTESASGAPMTVNSATSPITDTVSCRAVNSVAGNYFQFANGSDFDTTTRNLLALKVRLTAAMPTQKSLVLQWYDGTIARGTPVPLVNGAYGFSRTLLTAQLIPIPMAAFGVTGLPVDTFRITTSGGGSSVSYTVDDIIMQAGVGQAPATDAMRWKGAHSAVVQYVLNDVVTYGGGIYRAGAPVLATLPPTAPWERMDPAGTQTLTDAATVAWDCAAGAVSKVTLGGNRTLGAPTNQRDGGTYVLRVIQDGTGSRTLAYNSVFKWPGGTDPVLSTAAGSIDILTFVSDGTNMYGVIQKAFAT